MSGLWTNDRDTLAEALFHAYAPGRKTWRDASGMRRRGWLSQADRLLATGVVRVLDPDDTELVERAAHKLGWSAMTVRAVVEALRQP
jgi:hypothetical protein